MSRKIQTIEKIVLGLIGMACLFGIAVVAFNEIYSIWMGG